MAPVEAAGMDVTSERELLLMGENYRLKEKIDRVIEHAEETISELQVELTRPSSTTLSARRSCRPLRMGCRPN